MGNVGSSGFVACVTVPVLALLFGPNSPHCLYHLAPALSLSDAYVGAGVSQLSYKLRVSSGTLETKGNGDCQYGQRQNKSSLPINSLLIFFVNLLSKISKDRIILDYPRNK